ncbi:MAG: YceI family protein [Dyella sp.]
MKLLSKSSYGVAALGLLLALQVGAAQADSWNLDAPHSELHFVTTKAGKPGIAAIEEVQTFNTFTGKLDSTGQIQLTVDLGSVQTQIPLRDQRIRDMLFKVTEHPNAQFTAQFDMSALKGLKTGQFKDVSLSGSLALNGTKQPLDANLRVVKLAHGALLVSTRQPIVVDLQKFDLSDGVTALHDVMALNVLSASAPVSFSLVLNSAD